MDDESHLYTNWWQIGSGNIYANQEVSNYQSNLSGYRATDLSLGSLKNADQRYVLARADSYQKSVSTDLGTPSKEAGLQITATPHPTVALQDKASGDVTTPRKLRTYRDSHGYGANSVAGAHSYSAQGYNVMTDINLRRDYAYYRSLFDYSQIAPCASGFTDFADESGTVSKVCQFTGNVTDEEIVALSGIGRNLTSGKYVIFVEGNFTLNGAGTAGQLQVQPGAFLGLIVSGTFTVAAEVGIPMEQTGNACLTPTSYQSSLDAFLVARDMYIAPKSDSELADPIFNGISEFRIHCDNRLIMAGTYAIWGTDAKAADVEFTRTLRGCNLKEPSLKNSSAITDDPYCRDGDALYLNRNKDYSATTINYRPDFVVNMPAWMRESVSSRLEVQ
jgi:hypothetical protein